MIINDRDFDIGIGSNIDIDIGYTIDIGIGYTIDIDIWLHVRSSNRVRGSTKLSLGLSNWKCVFSSSRTARGLVIVCHGDGNVGGIRSCPHTLHRI